MDPITAALAAGAGAGMTDVAGEAVKDAYAQLKAALSGHFPQLGVQVEALESHPDSQLKQSSLAGELAAVDAQSDAKLMRLAKVLLDAIEREAPDAAARVGVDLEQVRVDAAPDAGWAHRREGRTRGRATAPVRGVPETEASRPGRLREERK